jgi:hypothetical protein
VLEAEGVALEEAQAVLSALALLGGEFRSAALEFLRRVCGEHGVRLDLRR